MCDLRRDWGLRLLFRSVPLVDGWAIEDLGFLIESDCYSEGDTPSLESTDWSTWRKSKQGYYHRLLLFYSCSSLCRQDKKKLLPDLKSGSATLKEKETKALTFRNESQVEEITKTNQKQKSLLYTDGQNCTTPHVNVEPAAMQGSFFCQVWTRVKN